MCLEVGGPERMQMSRTNVLWLAIPALALVACSSPSGNPSSLGSALTGASESSESSSSVAARISLA